MSKKANNPKVIALIHETNFDHLDGHGPSVTASLLPTMRPIALKATGGR